MLHFRREIRSRFLKPSIIEIEAILRVRFRAAYSQVVPEIRLIGDPDKLERILSAAETATSPEELRKLWAGEPGR